MTSSSALAPPSTFRSMSSIATGGFGKTRFDSIPPGSTPEAQSAGATVAPICRSAPARETASAGPSPCIEVKTMLATLACPSEIRAA